MTGIQALERQGITPMRSGDVERVEFEYIRHGPQCLLANFNVVSGQVIAPTVSDTRTDVDVVTHLRQTVALAPQDGWVFVLDQLNTHTSETLVHWIAEACGISDALGVKGLQGILASLPELSSVGLFMEVTIAAQIAKGHASPEELHRG